MKDKQNKVLINPNKMIIEIFIIALALSYLMSLVINKKTALVFYLLVCAITIFETFINYIKRSFKHNEKSKNRIFYIIICVVSILLLFSIFMKYIINNSLYIFSFLNKYMGILIIIYLVFISIKCFKQLKTKKNLLNNTIIPILSIIAIIVILICYMNMYM